MSADSTGATLPPDAGARGSIGWVRVALGAVIVLAGLVAVVLGIVRVVQDNARIDGDAVGRGQVGRTAATGPATFTVPAGGRRDYTVYLRLGDLDLDTDDQDAVAGDTSCVALLPGGGRTAFDGARQGVSVTLGSSVSVGRFSSGPGRVAVRCGFGGVTSAVGADAVPFVVTPGEPSGTVGGIVAIIAGAIVLSGGSVLLAWGILAGRRRRRT